MARALMLRILQKMGYQKDKELLLMNFTFLYSCYNLKENLESYHGVNSVPLLQMQFGFLLKRKRKMHERLGRISGICLQLGVNESENFLT